MFIFFVALLQLCLTDFSMCGTLPIDDRQLDVLGGFLVDESFQLANDVERKEMESMICKVLGIFTNSLYTFKKAYYEMKEKQNDYNSTEIYPPQKDFSIVESQCSEVLSYVQKVSNSTETTFLDQVKVVLTIRDILREMKNLLQPGP